MLKRPAPALATLIALSLATGCEETSYLPAQTVSTDTRHLAVLCGYHDLCLWNLETGKLTRTIRNSHGQWFSSVALSPNGQIVASGHADASITVWDSATGKELWHKKAKSDFTDEAWVYSLGFSHKGTELAAAGYSQPIRIWDVRAGTPVTELPGSTCTSYGLVFSPDDRILAVGTDAGEVRLFDVATGQEMHTLEPHRGWIRSVAFSPDGKIVASGSQSSWVDLWDVKTGRKVSQFDARSGVISALAFSPDGTTLATGGWDNKARLWNLHSGDQLRQLPEGSAGLHFYADGKRLIVGGHYHGAKAWDVATGTGVRTFICYWATWRRCY